MVKLNFVEVSLYFDKLDALMQDDSGVGVFNEEFVSRGAKNTLVTECVIIREDAVVVSCFKIINKVRKVGRGKVGIEKHINVVRPSHGGAS